MFRKPVFAALCFFAVLAVIIVFVSLMNFFKPEIPDENVLAVQNLEKSSLPDEAILSYLAESNFALPNFGGKMFIAYKKLGDNQSGTQATEYVWAVFQEYYVKNNKLEKGSGTSLPLALYFRSSKPVALNAPRDGSLYLEDIKKIFPDTIKQQPIFTNTAKHNEIVSDLQLQNKIAAESFFASSIKTSAATSTP